jgi:hypothetical protein
MADNTDDLEIIQTDRTTGEVTILTGREARVMVFMALMILILVGFLIGFATCYYIKH